MGLRTFIVGGAIEAAALRLESRAELTVFRASTVDEVLAGIDGSEPAIAMIPVSAADDQLAVIATLVARGAQVVALAGDESAGLRVAAFSAGVSDVLFAPFEPWFVEETVLALSGNPFRKDIRIPTQMEALLVPLGGVALAGNLISLSMGELRARVSGSLPPGAILRVALKPPRPHRLPVLFARARKSETLEDGRLEIHARFVGVTNDEQALLGEFLEQQPAEVDDVAAVLSAVDSLDATILRDAGRTLAGLTLPALTAPEAAWLRAAPGTADAALADVAVARCRAELTASLREAVGADVITLSGLPLDRYLDDIHRAQRSVTAALELFRRGDAALLRDLAVLQSRLGESARTLERIASEIADDARAAPTVAPMPVARRTAEPTLDLDDLVPVDDTPFAATSPPDDPTKPTLVMPKTDPNMAAAMARTNPQIVLPLLLPDDISDKTQPAILALDGAPVSVLIAPPAPAVPPAAPTLPQVVTRSGRRLRNPFAEE